MPILLKEPHRPWKPERKPQAGRLTDNSKIYNGKRWRVLSAYMAQVEPLCAACLAAGLMTAGEVTDHIKPIRDGGAIYARENLQRLCITCHASKSGKEAHHRGGGG